MSLTELLAQRMAPAERERFYRNCLTEALALERDALWQSYCDEVLDPLYKLAGNDGEAYKLAIAFRKRLQPEPLP